MMRSRFDMRTDGIQVTFNHANGRMDHGKLSDGLQGPLQGQTPYDGCQRPGKKWEVGGAGACREGQLTERDVNMQNSIRIRIS